MQLDTLYNEDCLVGMRRIPDGSIDAVICDPPYGTMKGLGSHSDYCDKHRHDWDIVLPTAKLFAEYSRILRRNGMAILFSQEPYTSHLRQFKGTWMEFCYPMIWKKDSAGNALIAKNAPMSYFEDISVFKRRGDNDAEKQHPLRAYSQKVISFLGKSSKEVQSDFAMWDIPYPSRVQHFLSPDGLQFHLCTAETYNMLIERYGIDKMDGFRTYEDLQSDDIAFKSKATSVFNLPEGANSMSNVLEFAKDTDGFHPTQKPVALMRRLVLTYTNMGGGGS